jgi:hypothetical protein
VIRRERLTRTGALRGFMEKFRPRRQAHRQTLSEVLSTPIEQLAGDAGISGQGTGVSAAVYIEQLSGKKDGLLPEEPGSGAKRHLNSVLHALSALEKNRTKDATPQSS